MADHAVQWIRSLPQGSAFFAWVHLGTLHGHAVGKEEAGAAAEYAEALREVDGALGKMLDALGTRTDVDLASQGIERRKEPILDEDIRTRKGLQQARLSGVRVPDECGRGDIATALALIGAMLGDVLQPLLEHRDLPPNDSAVGFELSFARSSQPDTAADT